MNRASILFAFVRSGLLPVRGGLASERDTITLHDLTVQEAGLVELCRKIVRYYGGKFKIQKLISS